MGRHLVAPLIMTVPQTLAVVLNPASGLQKADGTTSLRGSRVERED
ncbi:MAG: hypothetical protein LBD53_04065 [Tannerella sp.]|nr:hypothetical protein [Tannerella sp.]